MYLLNVAKSFPFLQRLTLRPDKHDFLRQMHLLNKERKGELLFENHHYTLLANSPGVYKVITYKALRLSFSLPFNCLVSEQTIQNNLCLAHHNWWRLLPRVGSARVIIELVWRRRQGGRPWRSLGIAWFRRGRYRPVHHRGCWDAIHARVRSIARGGNGLRLKNLII